MRARCPFEVDAKASLRLPGSTVADAQGSKCNPQTPPFTVAGPSGQRIRVVAEGRWMGLARWNPRRARRTAAAARRRRSVAESGGRGRGFTLLDAQLARRHRWWPAYKQPVVTRAGGQ
jgi:hypothetical protein